MKNTTPDTATDTKTFLVTHRLNWRGRTRAAGETIEATADELLSANARAYLTHEWMHEVRDGVRVSPAPAAIKQAPATKPAAAAPAIVPAGQVQMIPLDRIRPDPTQPRQEFAPEKMKELVDSIRDKGVQQAIQLRPMSRWRQIVSLVARQWVKRERGDQKTNLDVSTCWGAGIKISAAECLSSEITDRLLDEGRVQRASAANGGLWQPTVGALAPLKGAMTMPGEDEWLEIVYGERRWRGSQEAGVAAIPAKVGELSDIEAAELQAIENLKRADLLPMEDAAQYRKLIDTPGYGLARVMEVTGKAKNTIYGKLKLLDLPPEAQKAVQAGDLSASTGERLGRLTGRVQASAVKAILHAERYELAEGKKVPSDARCKHIIDRIEEAEAKRMRWEQACAAAGAKGIKPLGEKEAQETQTYNDKGEPRYDSKYVSGSQRCALHAENWTWNKILGKRAGELTKYLGRDNDWNGHIWMLQADAEAKAKEMGVKLSQRNASSGGSRSSAAAEAAERKRRAAEREKENAGLAEIVGKVQQLGPERLPVKFWRELASTVAADCWSDTSRRVSSRRGNGVKGRANETLSARAASMSGQDALALLTELVVVGMRGSSGMAKKIGEMRAVLGLVRPGEGAAGKASADVRTGAPERELAVA